MPPPTIGTVPTTGPQKAGTENEGRDPPGPFRAAPPPQINLAKSSRVRLDLGRNGGKMGKTGEKFNPRLLGALKIGCEGGEGPQKGPHGGTMRTRILLWGGHTAPSVLAGKGDPTGAVPHPVPSPFRAPHPIAIPFRVPKPPLSAPRSPPLYLAQPQKWLGGGGRAEQRGQPRPQTRELPTVRTPFPYPKKKEEEEEGCPITPRGGRIQLGSPKRSPDRGFRAAQGYRADIGWGLNPPH